MEHLDNDMDELFHKAGELYPLKITGSDWEGVAGKLRDENLEDLAGRDSSTLKGRSNRRRWKLLLILIPLGLAGLLYNAKITNQHKADTASPVVKDNPALNENDTKNNAAVGRPESGTEQTSGGEADNANTGKVQLKKENTGPSNPAAANQRLKNNDQVIPAGTGNIQSAGANRQINNRNLAQTNASEDAGELSAANTSLAASSGGSSDNNAESFHGAAAKPISLSVSSPDKTVSIHGMPIPVQPPAASTADNKSKKTKTTLANSRGIYAGFRIGSDLSMVKFQSVERPGFSLGLLIGYRFNKSLAIETGLNWDKKYYYSKGEYFNTDKIHVPNYWTIMNVDGNCSMWEIPLALRYDFSTTKNHGYFVKAGFSSYIMKKQNYSFGYDSAGYQGKTPYIPYNNTLKYFLATIQLSAGYEHALSEKTKIRIEPYVNIPLQGVGTGSLPISSLGFYLGISHSFR